MFVSISQVIGCEDRLRNDLDCVGWGVKLYSNSNSNASGWMHKINAVGIDCSLESALLCGHAELVVAPPFLSLFVDVGLHLRERVTADGHGRAEDVSQVSLVGAVSTLLPLARRI